MTLTEKLREQLDRYGVSWEPSDDRCCENDVTKWQVGVLEWVAFESEHGFILNAGLSGYKSLSVDEVLEATVG